jgi:hypothetical protein
LLGGASLAVTSVGLYFYLKSKKKQQELEVKLATPKSFKVATPKLMTFSQVDEYLGTKDDDVEPEVKAPIKQFEPEASTPKPKESTRPTQAELDQKYREEYDAWLARKNAWDQKEAQRIREINSQRQAEYQRQLDEIERQRKIITDRQKQAELDRQKAEIERQKQIEIEKQKQAETERQQQAAFEQRQKQIEIEKQKQADADRRRRDQQQADADRRGRDQQQRSSSQQPPPQQRPSDSSPPSVAQGNGQATPNPNGNRMYDNLLLLDYVVDPSTPIVKMTRPYKDYGDLTLDLKRAPALGLAKNPDENARIIAALLGSNDDKYKPTDEEVTKLAYVVSRERSSGADLGRGPMSPVNVQRERAAILWAIINAIPAYIKHYGYSNAPHTIDEVLARGTEYLNYKENPKMNNFNEMNRQLRADNRNLDPIDFRTLVRAFFDGHFNNEIGNNTNWVHAKVKKWSFFVIPPDARFPNGATVKSKCSRPYGCTSSEDVYIFQPDGIFGRAFVK